MPQRTSITRKRLGTLLAGMRRKRVVVIGDAMLDVYLHGDVERISPEAPVPVVRFEREEYRLGGAANVAHNIVALGGRAELVGLIGEDPAAGTLSRALASQGVAADGLLVDPSRPTTTKVRVVTDRRQQVARIDYEDDDEVGGAHETALVTAAVKRAATAGAIVVSDYLKGTVTQRLVAELATIARERGIPLLVDPKIPHLGYYTGATMITPNHVEAEIATHMRIRTDEDAGRAARAFQDRAGCASVLITRGEAGMWLLDATGEGALSATAREVADVTGAGDTVIATLVVALSAGATPVEAAHLANHSAGVVVGKFGPSTVSAEELLAAV